MLLLDEILAHAREDAPNEACGLVVASGKRHRLIRAANIATDPCATFDLDPDAWLEVADDEEVVGIYHSHPASSAEPSLADLSACEASELPWYIVGLPEGDYRVLEPGKGFRAPLLGRPYVYGVHDCYSLVRDWYAWERGVDLPDFDRQGQWWERGEDRFRDNLQGCGFAAVAEEEPVQVGDVFLIQHQSTVPNHIAIYLGDGTILHHAHGRLSAREPWGGFWARHRVLTVRHKGKMGSG